MSTVKVQGNASGTGSITLASPNTNSNRTINLPDVDGTIATTDANGNLLVGVTTNQNYSGGTTEITVGVTGTGATSGGALMFASGSGLLGYVAGQETDVSLGTYTSTPLKFNTANTERARIDSSGNLLVGTTTPVTTERLNVTSGQGSGVLVVNRTDNIDSNLRDMVLFRRSSTGVGSISCSNTATSYNTSSDYRLKENIAPMAGALSVVAQLKPVTYTWKTDGSVGQGFIAHELQEIVPDCVTGEKDAVDEDGNPVYQGIDTSFLVATLTAAIQELKADLDATKAELAALKGATQ